MKQKRIRRQAERAKKSASVMWINGQIIASAQKGISELMCTVSTHLAQMNLVNLTTAIHRLGKFASHDPKVRFQLERSPVFGELVATLKRSLSSNSQSDVQPQSLSNILWALASLRLPDLQLINIACEFCLPSFEKFKCFEVSTVLWAITKLSTIGNHVLLSKYPLNRLLDNAATIVITQMDTMEFRCLSMVAWSYATAKLAKYNLFAAMSARMTEIAHTANCQEMGNSVWAFGTFSLNETELFNVLAQKGISEMQHLKPQELSNMLWGFASCGFFHEAFYHKAALGARAKELSAQHVANILWAFSRVRPRHVLTRRTVLSFLPFCCQQIHSFKAQELSSVTFSVAKAYDGEATLPAEVIHFFACIQRAASSSTAESTVDKRRLVWVMVPRSVGSDHWLTWVFSTASNRASSRLREFLLFSST
jgi:hypothetical protein